MFEPINVNTPHLNSFVSTSTLSVTVIDPMIRIVAMLTTTFISLQADSSLRADATPSPLADMFRKSEEDLKAMMDMFSLDDASTSDALPGQKPWGQVMPLAEFDDAELIDPMANQIRPPKHRRLIDVFPPQVR